MDAKGNDSFIVFVVNPEHRCPNCSCEFLCVFFGVAHVVVNSPLAGFPGMELNQCLLFLVTNSILEFRNWPAPFPLSPPVPKYIPPVNQHWQASMLWLSDRVSSGEPEHWLGFLGWKCIQIVALSFALQIRVVW